MKSKQQMPSRSFLRLVLVAVFAIVLSGHLQRAVAQSNTFPSSGNAGIGTTSPSDPLHVSSASGVNIRMTDATNSVSSYLTQINQWSVWQSNRNPITGAKPDSGRTVAGIYFQALSGDSSIHFQTSTTNGADPAERMVIDKSGNVGIGTTAPTSFDGSTYSTQRVLQIYSASDAAVYLAQGSGGAALNLADSAANSNQKW